MAEEDGTTLEKDVIEHIRAQDWPYIRIVDGLPEGKGVFSTTFIPKDTFVCDYGGIVLSVDEGLEVSNTTELVDGRTRWTYLFRCEDRNGDTWYYDGWDTPYAIGRYFNHSAIHYNIDHCVEYIGNTPHIMFYTNQDIQPRTQLCIHYGPNYSGVNDCVAGCKECEAESNKALSSKSSNASAISVRSQSSYIQASPAASHASVHSNTTLVGADAEEEEETSPEWEAGSNTEYETGSNTEWETGSNTEWETGSNTGYDETTESATEWETGSTTAWESASHTSTVPDTEANPPA